MVTVSLDPASPNVGRSNRCGAKTATRFGWGTVAVLSLLTAEGSAAEREPKALLGFDMPHGECRLTVMSDGSALLSYGALPQHISARAGSFDPTELEQTFRTISHPNDEDRHRLSPPVGAVWFGSNERLAWFNDEGLANSLIHRAWDNRRPGDEPVIAKACGNTTGGTP